MKVNLFFSLLSLIIFCFILPLKSQENTCVQKVKFKLEIANSFVRTNFDSLKYFGNQAINESASCGLNELNIEATILLGDGYLNFGESDKAVEYYESALKKSRDNQFLKKEIISLYKKGRVFVFTDQSDVAVSCYKDNLKLLESERLTDTLWRDEYLMRSMGNLGVIYNNKGNYEVALEYFLKVMNLNEKLNNERGLSYTLNNIGTIYLRNFEEKKALKYLKKSLHLKNKLGFINALPESYLNVGGVYFGWNDFKTARLYFDSARIFSLHTNNLRILSSSYLNIGSCFDELRLLDSAKRNYKNSLEISNKQGFSGTSSIVYRNLSEIASTEKDHSLARRYIKKSLEFAEKGSGLQEKVNAQEVLALVDYNRGAYKSAYENRRTFDLWKDSLFNQQKAKELNELMVSYETEKKEQEIVNLNNEKQIKDLELKQSKNALNLTISVGVIIILVAGFIILIINQRRLKADQKSLTLEQKLLRTQMNPHFIFNSLNSIQKFILKNESLEAADYLSQFSALMRAILESSRLENISMEKEVAILESYLKLQQLRFGGKFDYEINIDEEIDLENTIIPPMLTQPFIENAIEHGMRGIDYKGEVKVRIIKNKDLIKLEVEDNGVGIQKSLELTKERKPKHISMAMSITKERLSNVGKNIDFQLVDLSAQSLQGTLVTFTLPLKFAS